MWHLDADKHNVSSGEPVLASADGVVTNVSKNGKEELKVFLDHGNGWTTQHKHLESLPPLKVGQALAQGEQIGRVGNTGFSRSSFTCTTRSCRMAHPCGSSSTARRSTHTRATRGFPYA